MKAGWQIRKLGEICDLQNGYAFKSTDYVEFSNTLNIRMSSIRPDGSFDSEHNQRFLPDSYANEYKSFLLSDKDLIIAMTDMAGDPKILGVPTLVCNKNSRNFLMNQRVGKLFRFSDQIHVPYLRYFLTSPQTKELYKNKGAGGLQINISKADVLSVDVPFSSIDEQQRIVAILDQAFENIAKARTNAEQNLQNARALFESHLQSVFTQHGEGWRNSTLKDISVDFGRGKSKHRPRNDPKLYREGKYPFIQTGDIRNCSHIITRYSQTYNDVGLAQSKLWPKGTLCITIAANIAETGILGFDSCFPDSVIGVVVDEKQTNIKFLEYLLQSLKTYLKSQGQGSAQDNINLGTFENQLFPFPPIEEQRFLVSKLDSLREETQRLEALYQRKIELLDELKKSLLQQAFAGEL